MKLPKALGIAMPFIGGAGALAMTAVITTTIMLTYMSDVVKNTATFTASVEQVQDTLDISGSYRVYLNGSVTPESTNFVNLVPGDVAVVKATITNNGSASAWVRDTFNALVTPASSAFLYTWPGDLTSTDFEDMIANGFPDMPGYTYGFGGTNGESSAYAWTSSEKVINGTGENAQVENEANAPLTLVEDVLGGYNAGIFVGNNSFDIEMSFYFDPDQPPVEDGSTYAIDATTKAMQYRGNNDTMPDQLCDGEAGCAEFWDVVVSSPIGL